MKNDFILDEDELSIASNRLINLSEEMITSIQTYIQIITKIQKEQGIKDTLISQELSEIIALVQSYLPYIQAVAEELKPKILEPKIVDAETYDNFEFFLYM